MLAHDRGQVGLARVDGHIRAEPPRDLQPVRAEVGDDDRARALQPDGHEGQQADGARAEDEHGVHEADGSQVGRVHPDGQRLHHRAGLPRHLRRQGVKLPRGHAHRVRVRAVGGHHAEPAAVHADIGQACAAVGARTARDGGQDGDARARLPAGHARADRADLAGKLVAHDHGRDAPACGAGEAVDIRPADADRAHRDDHFAELRFRLCHLAQRHLPRRFIYECFHVGSFSVCLSVPGLSQKARSMRAMSSSITRSYSSLTTCRAGSASYQAMISRAPSLNGVVAAKPGTKRLILLLSKMAQ